MTGSLFTTKSLGFAGSVAFHAIVILGGSAAFIQPVEYAVENGLGGIEVSLVAAPAAPEIITPPKEVLKQTDIEEFTADEKVVAAEPEPQKTVPQPIRKPEVAGDGSSAVLGKDPTTFSSRAGAIAQVRPSYLKNPAPRYPEEARRLEQEGLVLLRVEVGSDGNVKEVRIKESSGFPLLDQSALRTVRKWRFHPARAGHLTLDSTVMVPVRFRLDKI